VSRQAVPNSNHCIRVGTACDKGVWPFEAATRDGRSAQRAVISVFGLMVVTTYARASRQGIGRMPCYRSRKWKRGRIGARPMVVSSAIAKRQASIFSLLSGPNSGRIRKNARRSIATQPMVGEKVFRAMCRKMALPAPATVGERL
jgi:hypothetical protein